MTAYFFDASALVKRYLREVGSEWVRQLIAHEQPRIFISSLSGPEVLAAIMRKGRTGEASPPERDKAVRAYDAVQVASALTLPPPPHGVILTFVSADEGLLTVTKKLGCPIENPNLHP